MEKYVYELNSELVIIADASDVIVNNIDMSLYIFLSTCAWKYYGNIKIINYGINYPTVMEPALKISGQMAGKFVKAFDMIQPGQLSKYVNIDLIQDI